MNPHNLAICFSPVLMLDTSDHLDLDNEPSIVQQLQVNTIFKWVLMYP